MTLFDGRSMPFSGNPPRTVIDRRGRLLMAALGFVGCSMPSYDRALHALRSWLDSWAGIGHVAVGMARQGYDLQLTRCDEGGEGGRVRMPARRPTLVARILAFFALSPKCRSTPRGKAEP